MDISIDYMAYDLFSVLQKCFDMFKIKSDWAVCILDTLERIIIRRKNWVTFRCHNSIFHCPF